jgi:uncharacterized protein (TIGR00369 family)
MCSTSGFLLRCGLETPIRAPHQAGTAVDGRSWGSMTIFGADLPFPAHCGIEEVGAVGGGARVRLVPQPHHMNNLGIPHGGIICTLLDVAMGSTCRVVLRQPVMTLDMQVAFVTPGRGPLLAQGSILRAGRSLIYVEGRVFREEDEELVAKGSGIFKIVKRRPEEGTAPDSSPASS